MTQKFLRAIRQKPDIRVFSQFPAPAGPVAHWVLGQDGVLHWVWSEA